MLGKTYKYKYKNTANPGFTEINSPLNMNHQYCHEYDRNPKVLNQQLDTREEPEKSTNYRHKTIPKHTFVILAFWQIDYLLYLIFASDSRINVRFIRDVMLLPVKPN